MTSRHLSIGSSPSTPHYNLDDKISQNSARVDFRSLPITRPSFITSINYDSVLADSCTFNRRLFRNKLHRLPFFDGATQLFQRPAPWLKKSLHDRVNGLDLSQAHLLIIYRREPWHPLERSERKLKADPLAHQKMLREYLLQIGLQSTVSVCSQFNSCPPDSKFANNPQEVLALAGQDFLTYLEDRSHRAELESPVGSCAPARGDLACPANGPEDTAKSGLGSMHEGGCTESTRTPSFDQISDASSRTTSSGGHDDWFVRRRTPLLNERSKCEAANHLQSPRLKIRLARSRKISNMCWTLPRLKNGHFRVTTKDSHCLGVTDLTAHSLRPLKWSASRRSTHISKRARSTRGRCSKFHDFISNQRIPSPSKTVTTPADNQYGSGPCEPTSLQYLGGCSSVATPSIPKVSAFISSCPSAIKAPQQDSEDVPLVEGQAKSDMTVVTFFVCEVCASRYRSTAGLRYHYHSQHFGYSPQNPISASASRVPVPLSEYDRFSSVTGLRGGRRKSRQKTRFGRETISTFEKREPSLRTSKIYPLGACDSSLVSSSGQRQGGYPERWSKQSTPPCGKGYREAYNRAWPDCREEEASDRFGPLLPPLPNLNVYPNGKFAFESYPTEGFDRMAYYDSLMHRQSATLLPQELPETSAHLQLPFPQHHRHESPQRYQTDENTLPPAQVRDPDQLSTEACQSDLHSAGIYFPSYPPEVGFPHPQNTYFRQASASSVSQFPLTCAHLRMLLRQRGYTHAGLRTPSHCGYCQESLEMIMGESLIECTACRVPVHTRCVLRQSTSRDQCMVLRSYPWLCIECKTCWWCGAGNNENQMICCAECDRGFHTYCILRQNKNVEMQSLHGWRCDICPQFAFPGNS